MLLEFVPSHQQREEKHECRLVSTLLTWLFPQSDALICCQIFVSLSLLVLEKLKTHHSNIV